MISASTVVKRRPAGRSTAFQRFRACHFVPCVAIISRKFHEILFGFGSFRLGPVRARSSSRMEDSQIDKLFAGDLENLPPWRQPLIRLYLSSTYTDMTLEKTALFAEVYPKLKEYCREKYGLEFQVSSILTLELSIR